MNQQQQQHQPKNYSRLKAADKQAAASQHRHKCVHVRVYSNGLI